MSQSPHSDSMTSGIRVQAAAQFMPEHSDPGRKSYVYVYRIVMSNQGDQKAGLQSRHWVIRDADGHREDVRGPGVVGEFPDLEPGDSFEYLSSCPLPTRWGTMEGSYGFRREDGVTFEVEIGRFFLVPTAPTIFEQVT